MAAKRLVEARQRHAKGQATVDRASRRSLSVDSLLRTYQNDVEKKQVLLRKATASCFPRASRMRFVEPDFGLLSAGEKRKITFLRHDLLDCFAEHGRDLPWRGAATSTFERICVEVLLQSTRAETVAAVYPSFFGRFRGWHDIAEVSISELEEHLKPIGLWRRRAISLNGLATYAAEREGQFPSDPTELGKVPGVGQYVMNDILLFQHGARTPLVDVNMARVLERFVRPRVLADIRYAPWLQAACHWLVIERPVETNWATLDFAARVCLARRPVCHTCPTLPRCTAVREAVTAH